MKRDNCIDVKHVSHLSVSYLSRFFGSVGPVSRVEKDEVSKYVTIQFANRNSVDKAFRFNGRVLDSRPIKIKKCRDPMEFNLAKGIEQYRQQKNSPRFYINESTYSSLNTMQDMWHLIQQEVKPHHFSEQEHLLLSMFIWALIDQLLISAKHIHRYRSNRRSGYLTNTLEKYTVEKIARKNSNLVLGECLKTTIEQRGADTLVWFSVPFPNIQEDEAKIQSVSCMTKCIHSLKNGLSLRLAQIVYVLNAASLCANTQQTGSEELLNLSPEVRTTEQDNFIGIVDNIGAKNIFYEWLVFQHANSCIYLPQSKMLRTWHCSLRLQGCQDQEFQDANWCNMYIAQIVKRTFQKKDTQYVINRLEKIQNIKLRQRVLIFEYGQFSLKTIEEQISIFKEINPEGAMVFYINKQVGVEKTHQFKKVYEDDIMKILQEVEHFESKEQPLQKKESTQEQEQVVADIIEIEIKSENSQLLNNLKLTHYLQHYIEESIVSKGLIIASKEMAIKLAANIIEREKESRLFEFGYKRYEQFVGEQLWRVYNRQGERKIKSLLSKYTRQRR